MCGELLAGIVRGVSDVEIVHPVPVDDGETWAAAMRTTFLLDPTDARPGDAEFRRGFWRPERRWGAWSRGRWVGTLATFETALTIPGSDGGTNELTADALTMVTVSATHRRRGLLTSMLRGSLQAARDRGDAVSILFAAEWPIYGRFGYAPATLSANYTVRPRQPGIQLDALEVGSVHQLEPQEFGKVAPSVYDTARRLRAGNILRDEWRWRWTLGFNGIPPEKVEGKQPNFFVHESPAGADGFVSWIATREFNGVDFGAIQVVDLCAATDSAYRAVWAYLMGIDLIDEIRLYGRPVDEPVRWLLRDGRALRQTHTGDAVWLRLLDVPAALSARCYATTDRLVLDVVDDDYGGYGSGTFTLEAGPDGATCAATPGAAADLRVHQRALAGAYLGGWPLLPKLGAGLVDELTTGALRRADAMFTTGIAPWCATEF
jgi:predicted acetyltransferase